MTVAATQLGPAGAAPLVFVSYSWDSDPHMAWVREEFTNGLRSRGVDAVVDVHATNYGDLLDDFMEGLAGRCNHIAVICTPNYATRARGDIGGVGYEKALIKKFLTSTSPTRRVVPILREGDASSVPPFLGSRIWVDMRSDSNTEILLDELTALFYGQQIYRAAPLEEPPDWVKKLVS
ncbi:toll/interleukin-1 receptor domain-containing protein [Streptomyces chartreusis]|uniref:toll/interleukin-1 receptor domain-containing protein n=1 Tax=Streptomyces chartreusis TaxID=1969 RepID=UPI0038640ECA|nr:toll/interleukin-1 receptor domain-containing protein [Streptomyces chartreusis]